MSMELLLDKIDNKLDAINTHLDFLVKWLSRLEKFVENHEQDIKWQLERNQGFDKRITELESEVARLYESLKIGTMIPKEVWN